MKLLVFILLNVFLCQFCLADTSLDDALFMAIHWNDLESAKKLIQSGANVNVSHGAPQSLWTPLHRASELGRIELVKLLVSKGARINDLSGDRAPLHQAAYHGCSEVVALLLTNGADPNIKRQNGETPLHWAANHSYHELVTTNLNDFWPALSVGTISNTMELLIQGGANVNAKATSGSLVRHKRRYELDCITPEINTNTTLGTTPLHMVVLNGNRVLEDLLIKHGADVDARDLSGWTLLHWAAANNETNVIARLVKRGARLNLKDKDERTPLFRAEEFNCKEAIELIRSMGGL